MKKQKLSLEELKVKSFVTKLEDNEGKKGGTGTDVIVRSVIATVIISAAYCPLSLFCDQPVKPIDEQPGEPILNDTGVPGPCNTNPICIA